MTTRRSCSEPDCGAPITHQSKTGRCRPCAIARMHADPDYQHARRAGLARYYEQPGVREAHGERLRQAQRNPIAKERGRLKAHGRWLYANHASRGEVVERAQSPAARARAAAANTETRLGW